MKRKNDTVLEDIDSFSNSMEYLLFYLYMYFLGANCESCAKYVWYKDVTEENPVCPIEERIGESVFDETKFPSEYIKQRRDPDGGFYIPHCTEFEEIENL